ncbi:MAG: GAF domain-containing protein [Candidatus Rokubacteria bacterium]|nr:GAF domain-containing protein [Candidatus Rokubacteria bacterium]
MPQTDTERLRQTLRDLVAITAMPRLGSDLQCAELVAASLERLVTMLRADVGYARISCGADADALQIAHVAGVGLRGDDAAPIGRVLDEWLDTPTIALSPGVAHPTDPHAKIALVTIPFSAAGRNGVVAIGGTRDAFPSDTERLILEIAANHAVIALHGATVSANQERQAQQLRRSEERYRTLLSNLPGVAYRARAETGWPIEYLGAGVIDLTGYAIDDFIGAPPRRRFRELIHPDDRAGVRTRIKAALAERQPYENIFRVATPASADRWLWDRGQGLYDDDGRLVAIEGFITEITALNRAEANLREQTDALETVNHVSRLLSAELDYQALVQAVTDAATRLTHAAFGAFFYNVLNERGESYMLYALSGVSRESFQDFPMPRNTPLFAPTFCGEGPVRIDDVRKDPRFGSNPPYHGMPAGHLPVRSYLAVPVVSRRGEVLGGLFFGHPQPAMFTERAEQIAVALAAQAAIAMDNARLYEKEMRARADAETANRSKDEFLATLSHELRTPLNAVLGWTVMLRAGQLDEPTRARALQAIERNARGQAQLIEDLLDISRIVAGKLLLESRPVDLGAVTEAALDALRPAADARRIELSVAVDDGAIPVIGDPARLQQIIWNLLSNAVKFTPEGGRVALRVTSGSEYTDIVVSDTGLGITADVLPYVFDRFRQGDSSSTRRHGGLGLGLALVKHLTELHGGSVAVQSDGPGHGATFTVRLPFRHGAEPGASAITGRRGTHAAEAAIAGLRILVVDGDREARELFSTVFARRGADVQTAGLESEALAIVAAWAPDVLVCDLEIPGEGGFALLQKLRAFDAECGRVTPAIAVSAYDGVDDRMRAIAAGFRMHVSKPVDPAELALIIASVAGRIP